MALKGIKIIEMSGLAPAPFCGMVLSDFGASVVRVDRVRTSLPDTLGRGKQSIAVNMKSLDGQSVIKRLCSSADVLIEPYRPGVMEKLNLGPDVLMKENSKLIYARLSGYGQSGPFAPKAGHDINYLAVSGVLSMFGRENQKPTPPVNILADFGGGGLLCAFAIVSSLYERTISGKGQVIDCSMTEGAAYLCSFLYKSQNLPIWGASRGQNWLDSGAHFYDTYETKDSKYMAVGAIEPQFYAAFMDGLGLCLEQFSDFKDSKSKIAKAFKEKTQSEWVQIFDRLDACVTPVLELSEAQSHQQNLYRNSFVLHENYPVPVPRTAPKLSRSTATDIGNLKEPKIGEHTLDVLTEIGYSSESLKSLLLSGVIHADDSGPHL